MQKQSSSKNNPQEKTIRKKKQYASKNNPFVVSLSNHALGKLHQFLGF